MKERTETVDQRIKVLEDRVKELEQLLAMRPPKASINDQRYWAWSALAFKALNK